MLLASLLKRSGKTIEEACNSGRMPGSAARRIDTLAVQFFGDGAMMPARSARPQHSRTISLAVPIEIAHTENPNENAE
jgi:hypothetical protein